MDIQLGLPHAEIYSIDFPQKKVGRHQRKKYVREALCALHPGFCDESLWDYKCVKQKGRKIIKAVVLNRDFYLENKHSKRNIRFFIEDHGGKKIFLFKRKPKKLFCFLIPFLLALAVALYFALNRNDTEAEVNEEETVEVIEDVPSVFDYMNDYASVIKSHGGTIKLVQFNGTGGELLFLVNGCEPYSLVKDFNAAEGTEECSCGNVTYSGGKENFEVKIKIRRIQIRQKFLSEIELLKLQSRMTEKFREKGFVPVNGGVQEGSGGISFLFECAGKELAVFNEKVCRVCEEEKVFLSDFTETKDSSSGIFTVSFSVVTVDERQNVRESIKEECLSKVFETLSEKKKEAGKKVSKTVKPELKNSGKLTKIGSVKKEGRLMNYYRTEDGKIIISEE